MYLVFGFIFCLLLFIDIVTKVIASQITKPIVIIPDFFKLVYLENKGAAWGIGQSNTVLFAIISIIFILSVIIFLCFFEVKDKIIFYSIAAVFAGAVGNCFDRIFNGYVVDFFDFHILGYDFPVFNIADVCIVVGMICVMFEILTNNKELIVRRKKHV